jgi:hypothetical protein
MGRVLSPTAENTLSSIQQSFEKPPFSKHMPKIGENFDPNQEPLQQTLESMNEDLEFDFVSSHHPPSKNESQDYTA